MEIRWNRIGKMEKQLQKWGVQLDDLAARATTAGAQAKADERQLIVDLRAKQELTRARLEELKAASGDKWETFKDGVESAYGELDKAFKKISK